MDELRETIGVIGLGRMGRAMAERFAGEGYEVTGWNRTPPDAAAAAALGFPLSADLCALVQRSSILVLSLFDDAAVREVLARILETGADLSGRLIVDTSTVAPDVLRGACDSLATRGAALLDAPISGGPEMILAGKAGLYLGGAEADIARFRPLAETLGARVLTVGPLGAGATAKVLNNMMLVGYWQILKETVRLARAAGLEPRLALDILAGSPAATPAMKSRLAVILGDSDAVGFTLAGALKDGELATGVADGLGIDTPAIDAAVESFRQAKEKGLGDADLAVMVRDAYASMDG